MGSQRIGNDLATKQHPTYFTLKLIEKVIFLKDNSWAELYSVFPSGSILFYLPPSGLYAVISKPWGKVKFDTCTLLNFL